MGYFEGAYTAPMLLHTRACPPWPRAVMPAGNICPGMPWHALPQVNSWWPLVAKTGISISCQLD